MKRNIGSIKILMIMIASLALISCGGKLIKGAAVISGAGTTAYQGFDNVYSIIEGNIDAFSPRDVMRLKAAGETLRSVKEEVHNGMVKRGSALDMVNDLADLIPLYEKARIAYLTANNIVVAEIDEFDRADQMTLYAFQETCVRLDTAITDAINSGGTENAQLVKDIIGFVILVGKIAIPLIIL